MKILVVGSGGREYALTKKLAESALVTELAVAPGSDAIKEVRLQNGKAVLTLPFQATYVKEIAAWARRAHYDLVVPGPESCLEAGLGDWCLTFGIPFCGPSSRGARLETSKAYQHEFNKMNGIPSPDGCVCETRQAALAAVVGRYAGKCAVKADGPALGKGVRIARNAREAEKAVRELMLEKKCGRAGERVVIQELLEGEELSLHVIVDKRNAYLLETVRDYKRATDSDADDSMTGGMGGYSPGVHLCGGELAEIQSNIIARWRAGCAAEELTYRGILYPGLMLTLSDGPMVLEFNVRFGDPETQTLMRRFKGDLAELLFAAATDQLREDMLTWSEEPSVCVVMASRGYPGKPEVGKEIFGLEDAEKVPGVEIFHAGTKRVNGQWYTAGGRPLSVTAVGKTFAEARVAAYEAVSRIKFEGAHFRRTIGVPPLLI